MYVHLAAIFDELLEKKTSLLRLAPFCLVLSVGEFEC